jgi:hypothetical protein
MVGGLVVCTTNTFSGHDGSSPRARIAPIHPAAIPGRRCIAGGACARSPLIAKLANALRLLSRLRPNAALCRKLMRMSVASAREPVGSHSSGTCSASWQCRAPAPASLMAYVACTRWKSVDTRRAWCCVPSLAYTVACQPASARRSGARRSRARRPRWLRRWPACSLTPAAAAPAQWTISTWSTRQPSFHGTVVGVIPARLRQSTKARRRGHGPEAAAGQILQRACS